MNRMSNGSSTISTSVKDKSKDWQLEILMEKLRSKATQFKGLPEISKNVRMAMLDKRYALDSVDKSQHQKCLDTLQHSIKVTSFQSMIERLESLTRQLGLKFVVESTGVFISSDMFYLEIVLDTSGVVKDVKIHHEGKTEQQSCLELVNCLSSGDFADFTAQLEGFVSIYQLNAEKKVKCKAFTALESLEADLNTLAQLQGFMKEPFNLIHKSPVGILEKRKGGHPMKLTYFVSPYDLLNVDRGDLDSISIENVIRKSLGYNVTVCMEGAAAHKLQTSTLITVNRSMNGKGTPSYSPLTNQNSTVIPACFVLKLNKPMPMCLGLVRKIQQIQQWSEVDNQTPQPMLNLIVKHVSDGKMECANNRGLFVTLPDQTHCYFMTDNKTMEGVLVQSIPFTHPAHVANILMILREQALFNTIISSCVRPKSRQDFENMTMFEVTALSPTHVSISLEHPLDESMATVEMDLSDIGQLTCRVHGPGTPPPPNAPPDPASDLGTRILNRSFSVPVTMRSVIRLWESQSARENMYNGHENFSLPLGSGDPGGHKGGPGNTLTEYGGLNTKVKEEPTTNTGHNMMMQGHQGMFLNESVLANANFSNFPPSEGVLSNMELLSSFGDKSKRQKRKATDELWKSSKRRVGEDDLIESSSCDSTSRSTPLSQENDTNTPNSALGFQPSDFELSSLDPAELLQSEDKDGDAEFEGIDELADVEDILAAGAVNEALKNDEPPLLDNKSSVMTSATLSITPVTAGSPGFSPGGVVPETSVRPGIEIIPLAHASMIPSSITITPISSSTSSKSSEERSKDKKSSKSKSDDKNRLEKKKKKKRDGSPMGPPDKVPMKQDPLLKPVSVSIKPAESPPSHISAPGTPTSPGSMMRKFSASPTHNRPSISSLSGKLSPNLVKSSLKTGSSVSTHQSPKHSPAHIASSPKHMSSGISSPKHVTSPKHPAAGGGSGGKPSMSTLKSAANSPSGKGGSSGDSKNKSSLSSSKDSSSSRDKDKKQSSSSSSSSSSMFSSSNSKSKSSSSVKVKPLDLNVGMETTQEGLSSPSGGGDSRSNPNQVRNRKGSLSAIVDKLKVNAQHCDSATDLTTKSSSNRDNRERTSQSSNKSLVDASKMCTKVGEPKNSEYMVKPSSDGMKITINKTRGKESKSSSTNKSSNTGTGSPKIHTGLKPGVNSGPASKKSVSKEQILKNNSISGSATNAAMVGTSSSAYNSLKGSSSSNSAKNHSLMMGSKLPNTGSKSISKQSGSPKTSTGLNSADFNRSKDRIKSSKSGVEKSFFTMKERGKGSPTPGKDDSEGIPKITQLNTYPSMEGIIKQLDFKKFQIPKLSARSSEDKKSMNKDTPNNIGRSTVDTNIFETTSLPKYANPITFPNKTFENSLEQKRNNVNINLNIGTSGLKNEDMDDKKKDLSQSLSSSQGTQN